MQFYETFCCRWLKINVKEWKNDTFSSLQSMPIYVMVLFSRKLQREMGHLNITRHCMTRKTVSRVS